MARSKEFRAKYTADASDALREQRRLEASTGKLGKKWQAVGKKMSSIGRGMTAGITLPVLAVGAASVKMAMDFEESMAKITGLVGVGREQVEAWKGDVRDLAKTTGRSAKELADALFFITSAGFRGSDAIDALTVSAQAARAGLGETVEVADAITSAINAYGKENLSAAEATDVLVATVREGKLEASQLPGVLGRLIPLSKELGVEFHEVGAALAVLSKSNGDAAQSATMLRGILNKLLKPSEMAKDVLKDVGLSAEGLRQNLAEKGLLDTLRLLRDRIGDNQEAFGKFWEDSEALAGALTILGADAGEVDAVFASLAGSTGALNDAVDSASKTTRDKMNRAIARLKDLMLELGERLLPVVAEKMEGIASAVETVVEKFKGLPEPVQKGILVFGGILVVAGPLLLVLGAIVSAAGAVGAAFGISAIAALGFIGAAAAVVAVVVGLAFLIITNWETIKQKTSEVWGAITGFLRDQWQKIKDLAHSFWNLGITRIIRMALGLWFTIIAGTWRGIFNLLRTVWGTIASVAGAYWGRIGGVIGGALDRIKGIVSSVARFIGNILGRAWNAIASGAQRAWSVVVGAFHRAESFIRGIVDRIKSTFCKLPFVKCSPIKLVVDAETAVDGVVRAFKQMDDRLPREFRRTASLSVDGVHARGGPAAGPAPRSSDGSATVVVNVHGSVIHERELAEVVRRALHRDLSRNRTTGIR